MEIIKTTMYNIALISIVTGLLDLFSSSSKYKKYINYIASIITIIAIISPISSVIYSIKNTDFNFNVNEPKQEQNKYIKQTLEMAILDDITGYFNLSKTYFEVNVKFIQEENSMLIECVELIIKDENYFRHAQRIEAYLNENYNCETKVIQEFKENK